MLFCYFYILSAIVGLFMSIVSVGMYLDPYIWVRLLGQAGWKVSYYFIIVVQPVAYFISIVGSVVLVRWLIKRPNRRCNEEGDRPYV